jgi:hypothetical protein
MEYSRRYELTIWCDLENVSIEGVFARRAMATEPSPLAPVSGQ